MNLEDKIIVANSGENSLSIIDCQSWEESCRIYIPFGYGPYALAKTKDTSHILVIQYFSDSLLCVDLKSKIVKESIFLGRRPSHMVVDLNKNTLYITNTDSNSISIVSIEDEITVIGQVSVGSMPQGIDCYPEGEILAVANTYSNSIYIIDTFDYSILNILKLESFPFEVKFSTDGRKLFVGNFPFEREGEGSIFVINTFDYNIDYIVPIKGMPGQIYETKDGRYILVTSIGEGGLQIIDTEKQKVIKKVVTNGMSHGIALDKNDKYAYVTNTDDNSVSIVDWKKGEKLTNIKVGEEPNGILFISNGS